jgi:hypothetical protein
LLISDRKKLLQAKKLNPDINNDNTIQNQPEQDKNVYIPLFVFNSNEQRSIKNNVIETAQEQRKITVDSYDENCYRVSITDSSNGKMKMNPTLMHKVSYSDIDECLSMESNDTSKEYTFNIFFINGQVDKCVIYRKSKDLYIHYLNK